MTLQDAFEYELHASFAAQVLCSFGKLPNWLTKLLAYYFAKKATRRYARYKRSTAHRDKYQARQAILNPPHYSKL